MPAGRPSKLDKETADKFFSSLKYGVGLKLAADSAGLSRQTVMHWAREGKKAQARIDEGQITLDQLTEKELEYLNFLKRYRTCETETTIKASRIIQESMEDDPANARWWNERRAPQRFGKAEAIRREGRALNQQMADHLLSEGVLPEGARQEVAKALQQIGIQQSKKEMDELDEE